MKKFLVQLIGLSLVVYYLLPEFVDGIATQDYRAAIIAAVLFSFINIAVKPILRIVTLPFNILTLGLFGFVVNILLFWFVASIITGFRSNRGAIAGYAECGKCGTKYASDPTQSDVR